MFHSVWTKQFPDEDGVKTHHKYLLDVILLHSHCLVLTRTKGTHCVDLTVGGGREEGEGKGRKEREGRKEGEGRKERKRRKEGGGRREISKKRERVVNVSQ